eukprot:6854686-Alexandrium_andersonii.AAC.1
MYHLRSGKEVPRRQSETMASLEACLFCDSRWASVHQSADASATSALRPYLATFLAKLATC